MTEITETATIGTDPDTLWREAGGFGTMADWHPLLDRLELDGSGPGAVRRAYGKNGDMQIERLLSIDSSRHEMRYEIQETALPVKNWTAAFRIEPRGAGHSRVVITEQYEPTAPDDPAAAQIHIFLRTGLDALAKRYPN